MRGIGKNLMNIADVLQHSAIRIVIICCALLTLLFGFDAAQGRQAAPSSTATSGAETYKQYCAVCHGRTGKGDGPAVPALKVRPPDLTALARRHGGKFPNDYVSNVLRDGVKVTAHGTAEMPIWGPLFLALDSSFQSQSNLRLTNLTNYVRSLQK